MSWSVLLAPRQLLDQDKDSRVGGARNDTDGGGTISLTAGNHSNSLSSLLSTLVPTIVFVAICVGLFWLLRHRLPRVYSPRLVLRSVSPTTNPVKLPSHWFRWVREFFAIDDTFLLHHVSLDSYLFLRYMRILCVICVVGCVIVWPALLPTHFHGGGSSEQLDRFTIGNIVDKNLYFVHAVVSFVYFAFILYTIYRECIFYINLRYAYLMSPYHAKRLSSRTVLFTCVPDRYLDPARLRKVFGDTVVNVWIPKTTKELEKLVTERDQTAIRLEKAEIELIKRANKARNLYLEEHPDFAEEWRRYEEELHAHTTAQTQGTATATMQGNPTNSESGSHQDSTASSDPVKSKNDLADNVDPSSVTSSFTTNEKKVSVDGSEKISSPPETLGKPSSDSHHSQVSHSQLLEGTKPSDDSQSSAEKPTSPSLPAARIVSDTERANAIPPELADINGAVAAQWLPAEKRPTHRPLANYLRRVDTIKWTRNRIRFLNPRIRKMRRLLLDGQGKSLPAAFVEFSNQADAERAFQTLSHHLPMHMSPRYIGVRPDEIVWSVLNMSWYERLIKRFLAMVVITLGIIFWSIPSVLVGIISNIYFISDHVPPLAWVVKLPEFLIGIIQGFLPALALSMLMAIVPWLLRICARASGIPSLSRIELFCQNAYFAFQVVQVFLITTLTSAASAAIMDIIKDPLSAKDILSANLPKSSNFYIAYILIQCLAVGARALLHIMDVFRYEVMAKKLGTPRKIFRTWNRLKVVHWGAIFPVFTNMGVIVISYSCIAPLVLGFAAVGMYMIYLVYRYNLMYIYDSSIDTRGLVYPRALMQLLIGLYLAEICMIGLFVLRSAFIPMVLAIASLICTALAHMSLSSAISPLLYNLPRSLAVELEELAQGGKFEVGIDDAIVTEPTPPANPDNQNASSSAQDDSNPNNSDSQQSSSAEKDRHTTSSTASTATATFQLDPEPTPTPKLGRSDSKKEKGVLGEIEEENDDIDGDFPVESTARGLEGADRIAGHAFDFSRFRIKSKVREYCHKLGLDPVFKTFSHWVSPDPQCEPGMILRWLHPGRFDNFSYFCKMLPDSWPNDPTESYPSTYQLQAYWPPAMTTAPTTIWIPRDPAGVSVQEIAHTRKIIPITDDGVWLDEKCRVQLDLDKAPWYESRAMY